MPQPRPESPLKQALRQAFDAGLLLAQDPANANLPDTALHTTTINSPWLTRTCPVCKHKFREGDRVRLCPQCEQPYHDDAQYGLHCWQTKFADGQVCRVGGVDRFAERTITPCDFTASGSPPPDSETETAHPAPPARLVNQMVDGLEAVWSPFGARRPEQVEPGSAVVGRQCPWCRFTIRAGDWVVACPCGCGTYFHQDVFRHLTCWNEWNGVEGNEFCPITGRSYPREGQTDG